MRTKRLPERPCQHCRRDAVIGMNGYCAGCVEKGGTGVKLRGRAKCTVMNCENYTDQGEFVGSLCAPCHHYLSDPKCKDTSSQAYRNEARRFEDRLREVGADLAAKFFVGNKAAYHLRTSSNLVALADRELANLARSVRD